MTDLKETETFASHLATLADASVRRSIQAQLNRLRCDQLDQATAGEVCALTVADHRVYYAVCSDNQALLISIGQSACQDEELAIAAKLAQEAVL